MFSVIVYLRNITWEEAEDTCKKRNGSLISLHSGIADLEDMSSLLADKTMRDSGNVILIGLQCKNNVKYFVNF